MVCCCLAPIFGRKKEPKEVFDENMNKANKLWDSPKLWKSSEYKKLLKHIEKAQEIAETVKVDQKDIVLLWSMKGSVYFMGYHRFDEALECYDKALSINPREWGLSFNRLQVLRSMGKCDEVVKDCDKVLEIIPEIRSEKITPIPGSPGFETWDQCESMLWVQKGEALDRLTRVREALMCYDKAIELEPKNILAWCSKGVALSQLGRYEEALRCYDRALEINPRDWASLNEKGLALYHSGKYEEAMECINKSLEYGPKGPGSRFAAQRFRSSNVPIDVGTLLNKVRVLGTLAGQDFYDLSKQRPEEWAQKEREVEKMHEEIESCLAWAVHLNPQEFLVNIAKVSKDWESRGGLKARPRGCADCYAPKAIGDVVVWPLYFGKKKERMETLYGGNLSTRKKKIGL